MNKLRTFMVFTVFLMTLPAYAAENIYGSWTGSLSGISSKKMSSEYKVRIEVAPINGGGMMFMEDYGNGYYSPHVFDLQPNSVGGGTLSQIDAGKRVSVGEYWPTNNPSTFYVVRIQDPSSGVFHTHIYFLSYRHFDDTLFYQYVTQSFGEIQTLTGILSRQ